jgi:transposase
MATRTSRINALRGLCREFGMPVAVGAAKGLQQIRELLSDEQLPQALRHALQQLLQEVRELEQRIADLEHQLADIARHSVPCQNLLSVPGIGLLTATALVAATGGSSSHFRDARRFASWFGLTPKEHSSGGSRHLGRISKRGDRYLRMLLTHGARAVLNAATAAKRAGKQLDPLRAWALNIAQRSHHNKATCALANKLARICFAVMRSHEPYVAGRLAPQLANAI